LPKTHDFGRLFTTSLNLSEDAPAVHTAITAEYDHSGRKCEHSLVVRTPLRRRGRWHGLRRSWLSVQIKLPTGERLTSGRWGIVLGWWRYPHDDGWSALVRALHFGKAMDEADERDFTDPEFAGTNEDRGIGIVGRRRVDAPGDAGADG
jgi:hypothetical protein